MSLPIAKSLTTASVQACHKTYQHQYRKGNESIDVAGFFFLLYPGKYLSKAGTQFPFKLKQVLFCVRGTEFCGNMIPRCLLDTTLVTFAALIFDKQKNAVRDKKIGLGTSFNGDNPTAMLIAIVRHLQQSQLTTGETALFNYYSKFGVACNLTDPMITKYLRAVALSVEVDRPPTIVNGNLET